MRRKRNDSTNVLEKIPIRFAIGKTPVGRKTYGSLVNDQIFLLYANLLASFLYLLASRAGHGNPPFGIFRERFSIGFGEDLRDSIGGFFMKADSTDRRCAAQYFLTWYDMQWNVVADAQVLHTAHEMWECIERWNRHNQCVARDPAILITHPEDPVFVMLEVRYVEI